MLSPYRVTRFKDTESQNQQDATRDVFESFKGVSLLSGRMLEASLTTTALNVEHKLGREYIGYLVVDQDAAQTIYTVDTSLKKSFISLRASGNVTCKIWVF